MSRSIRKTCVFCGKEFLTDPIHRYAKYCSPLCNMHARRYGGTIAEMEATKAARKAARQAARQAAAERHRREVQEFGLTTEEKNSVLRGLHGTFEQHRAEAKTWNERQMKYAKKLYTERYLGGPTFVWGRY